MYLFFIKRFIDLSISFLFIAITLPIFFVVTIVLKFTGEGEILYLQERVGLNNKKFKIYKFATMVKNSPNMGTGSLTLRNDPRVLPFGKFLRKSKINEFPQIFNVFKGEMSIVGPRPQMEVDFLVYPKTIRNSIYKCKPGITGIGSIIFRDEEKYISESPNPKKFYKDEIAPFKGSLEMWYQQNISFTCDIKIILLTAFSIIFPNKNFANIFFKNLPKSKKF